MIIRVNPIGIFLLNTPLNRIFEYYRYYTNRLYQFSTIGFFYCTGRGQARVQRTVSLYNGIANTPCFVFPSSGVRGQIFVLPGVTSMCFP